jgi:hypothetical protein
MKKFLSISFFFMSILLIANPLQTKAQDIRAELDSSMSYLAPPNAEIHMTFIGPDEEPGHDYYFEVWTYVNNTNGQGDPLWLLASTHPNDSVWLGDQAILDLPDSTFRLVLKASRIDVDNSNGSMTTLWDTEFDTLDIDLSTSILNSEIKISSLYPNPSHNVLTVEYPRVDEVISIEIFDLTGKIVLKEKMLSEKHSFSIADLTSGIYVARFGNQTKRFEKR